MEAGGDSASEHQMWRCHPISFRDLGNARIRGEPILKSDSPSGFGELPGSSNPHIFRRERRNEPEIRMRRRHGLIPRAHRFELEGPAHYDQPRWQVRSSGSSLEALGWDPNGNVASSTTIFFSDGVWFRLSGSGR